MKRFFLLICFFSLFHFPLKALEASVGLATFNSPDKAFVEVYLNVMGTSVEYKLLDSLSYQAAVDVLILIKEEGQIINFNRYILNGPVSKYQLDFMDVQRFGLADGSYQLEVELMDTNDSTNHAKYERDFIIDYQNNKVLQSDVQLIRSFQPSQERSLFVKNGFHLEPLPYNFYYKTDSLLIFYQELYNSNEVFDDQFLLRYVIEREHGNKKMEAVMMGHKKLTPKPVNVILVRKNISKLESGNYRLLVEIKNRQGETISQKESRFQRSNPYRDEEMLASTDLDEVFVADLDSMELRYSLKAIASNVDEASVEVLNLVIAKRGVEAQKRYLFSFWARLHPENPKAAYLKYMEVAKAVDNKYKSGFGYGFETDRGRVFMKYGKPNDVLTVENEPSAPPYEIWFYDRVPSDPPQTNVKFLFYNPSLAGGNYQMLHSTCLGEVQNLQWEVELYRGDSQSMQLLDFEATSVPNGINRRAREYFNDL